MAVRYKTPYSPLVDQLAAKRDEIEKLQREADEIEKAIIAFGECRGKTHGAIVRKRVTVYRFLPRGST